MKYFLDTEFIEGIRKPLKWLPTIGNWNRPYHFIDLISIGMVAEDGREYYAVCNEFNPKDADEWVRENVLNKIQLEFYKKESAYAKTYHWESLTLKNFMKWEGKNKKEIAKDIVMFVYPEQSNNFAGAESEFFQRAKEYGWNGEQPEFYAYYADYDWVVFCSLFGKMIDLPKFFPMYCHDLKQTLDEVAALNDRKRVADLKIAFDEDNTQEYPLELMVQSLKGHPNYPKQENEHNALDDAKWNKRLYDFVQTIKNQLNSKV